MTALYGYVSDRKAFLGADDREHNSGKKADKISLVNGRFAVGFYGPDTTQDAVDILSYFHNTNHRIQIESPEALADEIIPLLQQIVTHIGPNYEAAVSNGDISHEDWEIVRIQNVGMVILDGTKGRLVRVELGSLFGDEGLRSKKEIHELEREYMHLFALAEKATGMAKFSAAPESLPDTQIYLQNRIEHDRKTISEIGSVGCFIDFFDGQPNFHTCFKSPHEVIDQTYPRILGYSINVSR